MHQAQFSLLNCDNTRIIYYQFYKKVYNIIPLVLYVYKGYIFCTSHLLTILTTTISTCNPFYNVPFHWLLKRCLFSFSITRNFKCHILPAPKYLTVLLLSPSPCQELPVRKKGYIWRRYSWRHSKRRPY